MVTISGDTTPFFNDPDGGVFKALKEVIDEFMIQRYEVDEERGLMRISVHRMKPGETVAMMTSLQSRLSGCHVSYVNMDTPL